MTRSLRRAVAFGVACGFLAFLAGELGWVAGLDARAYDISLRTGPPSPATPRIAVVEINDESVGLLGRWPWPRSRHAEFLRVLREHYHPSAVVFDLLFGERDKPEHDAAFASEIEASGNVYLAARFTDRPTAGPERGPDESPWRTAEYGTDAEWRGRRFQGAARPVPELARSAAAVGPVNVFPELDGCVRRMPLALDYQGTPYLSLLGAALDGAVNPEREPVTVSLGDSVSLGGYRVPVDHSGEIWVNYAAGSRGRKPFASAAYHSVLARETPRPVLDDKIVIVGFGAAGLADIHPTPLSSATLGVEINAHALNGLLRGAFVRTAGWPTRLLLAVVFAVAAALAAGLWSPGRALGVAVALPVLGLGAAAGILWWQGVWLGAAVPALGALGAYTTTVAVRHRQSERDSLVVRASVDTLARATRVIGSARRREDLLSEMRSQITEAMDALQTNLYLLDPDGKRLHLSLPAQTDRRPVSHEIGEGTVGWIASSGIVHLVSDIESGSSLDQELRRSVSFPVGSVVYAPMAHRGAVQGVVEVVRGTAVEPFEPHHLHVLEALATQAAVAFENAALYEKLEGRVEIANRQLLAAYQELKQERDRISAIVSNMADGVVLTDARGRILFMNPAAAQMLDLDAEEVEGHPIAEVLPYQTLLAQLEDEPAEVSAAIPRIQIGGQVPRILSPRTVRLTREEGGRAGAITVLSDITLLEQLSEMKTEFVSVVSHELRTPLTSIMGFAQTLHGHLDSLAAQERDEYLGIIEQESNRLLVMINDLLDMSRMEAGRPLPMNLEEVDLEELARHVVRFQQVTTSTHRFLFEFPDAPLAVEADSDKVEQILTNLVSNAIKYSPKGGHVVVGGRAEGDARVLYVRDQGVGMGPEEVEQLFQRYQRIDRDAIKGIRGTGLGLYLVRALVEAHHGRVWVESKPGEGSTFSFSLPAAQPREDTAPAAG